MTELAMVRTNFLTCSMCLEVFEEPKILTCLHRFCERCLQSWIIGSHTCSQNGRKGFYCPVCREFIEISDSDRSPSEWTSLLKTDFYVNSLISFVEAQRKVASDQPVSKPDHPCHIHSNEICDLYCNDCSTIICHLCSGVSHRKCSQVTTLDDAAHEMKTSLELKLQDANKKLDEISELNSSLEISMSLLKLRKRDAETEVRKWGQRMHQLITAEETNLLAQIRNEFSSRQEELAPQLNMFKEKQEKDKELFEALSGKVKTASNYDLMCDNSVLGMVKEFENSNLFAATSYRDFINKLPDFRIVLDTKQLSTVPWANAVSINFESNPTIISSPDNHLDNPSPDWQMKIPELITPSASPPEAQTEESTQHPQTTKRKQKLPYPEAYNSVGPVSYSYLNCQVLLNRSQIGTLKKVSCPQLSVALDRDELNTSQSKRNEAAEAFLRVKTIDTRVEEDGCYCDLRDIVVICSRSIILVTDWANQSVKAFDTRRNTHSRLVLGGKPWAITPMTDNLVAVSLPLSREISIVEISSLLWLRQTIGTLKSYFGLAALSSSLLVASSVRDTPCVDIINLKGEVLKSFSSDRKGAHMFAFPAYISLTPDACILVSDESMGALICISQEGEPKFVYKPKDRYQFHEARGVTAHSSGRILVAKSQGLLSLTGDGQFENILVKPQKKILLHPRGVAQDSSGLVYVTDKGSVHVFQYNPNVSNQNCVTYM